MIKNINKKHLKHLFSCHAGIEKRIADLEAIKDFEQCEKCKIGSYEINRAELVGLKHGETLIDAIINDYLNHYGS